MAEHTKGPWGLGNDGLSFFGPAPDEWGIGWLCLYSRGNGGLSDDEQRANARRVVACVNLLEGVSTEELEARALDGTAGGLVIENARLRAVLRRLVDAEEGRDDVFDVARAARAALGEGDADA
jgi:hypothetical protein